MRKIMLESGVSGDRLLICGGCGREWVLPTYHLVLPSTRVARLVIVIFGSVLKALTTLTHHLEDGLKIKIIRILISVTTRMMKKH